MCCETGAHGMVGDRVLLGRLVPEVGRRRAGAVYSSASAGVLVCVDRCTHCGVFLGAFGLLWRDGSRRGGSGRPQQKG